MAPTRRYGFSCALSSSDSECCISDDVLVVQFRLRLCVTMVLDYGGAWISDIVLKYFFGDTTPKELITRGSERREARRIAQKHEQELVEKVKKDE